MKKNEDELTELFRKRLKKYEIPLQEDMWDKLESELSKPSPRKLYSACFIAIAAIFLLLFACSAAVWMFTSREMPPALSKASVPVVEKYTAIAKAGKAILSELPVEKCNEPQLILNKEEIIEKTIELSRNDSAIDKVQPNVKQRDSIRTIGNQQLEAMAENEEENIEPQFKNEWTIGFSASMEKGKTISSIGDNLEPITINHKSPISFGISIGKILSDNLSLESGLNYTILRSESKDLSGTTVNKQNIHFLGIPLKLNWIFINKKNFDVYLSAGGMLQECISPKNDNCSGSGDEQPISINGLQCSLASSVGLQYNASQHLAFFAEPGVAYYFDDHTMASTIRRERPLNFNLRCGVKVMY